MPRDEKSDDDFNGVFESRSTYRNGVIRRTELDTDENEAPDVVLVYEHGILKREEITDPGHGTVARVNFYRRGRLERAEIDLDRDDFRETLRTFDRFGEITRTETRRPD